MILTPEEEIVIQLLRREGPYCKAIVEKRPTERNTDGEIVRVVVENSYMVQDMLIKDGAVRKDIVMQS